MTTQTLAPRRTARYGWVADLPDQRDLLLPTPSAEALVALPPTFSLRSQEPEPPYDQGQLGSCTANGIAFAVQFERKKQGLDAFRPSRLFIYYGERFLEGTVNSDSGAQIRDGMKVVAKTGAPPETDWPYDISRFAAKPPAAAYADAKKDLVLQYLRCTRSVAAIKSAILAGYPVVFGFTVYESFESQAVAQSGLLSLPQPGEKVLGGHCTVWMGWDDTKKLPDGSVGAFEVRNSWGTSWGDAGHCWMPYAYATKPGLASDYWTVRLVEAGS